MSWHKGALRADPSTDASENLSRSTSPVSSLAAWGERGSVVHITFPHLCISCPVTLFERPGPSPSLPPRWCPTAMMACHGQSCDSRAQAAPSWLAQSWSHPDPEIPSGWSRVWYHHLSSHDFDVCGMYQTVSPLGWNTQVTHIRAVALLHSVPTLLLTLPVALSAEMQCERGFSLHNSLHHFLLYSAHYCFHVMKNYS